jgi:geranylgeranyl pyrophosphate synthase
VAGLYGHWLGRAFQIADDLLDVTATAGEMGKGVGKDAAAGKQTYPAAVGLEESRVAGRRAAANAIEALESLSKEADDLRALANYVVQRHH